MNFKKNFLAFIIISVIGTLSHFVYEFSGGNYLAGLFFPVNESIWEHLKLLFFPVILYSFVEYFLQTEKPENYLQSTVFSIILGMIFIVVSYYTITGVLGKNIDFINIVIYFISVIITIYFKNKFINNASFNSPFFYRSALTFAIIQMLFFFVLSYKSVNLGIFNPPDIKR